MSDKLVKLAVVIFLITFSLQYNINSEESVSDEIKSPGDADSVQEAANRDRELLKKLMSQTRLPDPEVRDLEFEIGDNPVEGDGSAQLIIVQFSDYSCHHCALYTRETYPEIVKNYVDTGRLRYVVVDYPLPGNLPAIRASEAAHCAADQGKFREMHEEIMYAQEALDEINSMAASVGLDMEKFNRCMESNKYEPLVNKDMDLGTKLKIPSVPNFIIARIDPVNPEKVTGISYIRGAKPFEYFQQEIDRALADLKK